MYLFRKSFRSPAAPPAMATTQGGRVQRPAVALTVGRGGFYYCYYLYCYYYYYYYNYYYYCYHQLLLEARVG